MAARAEIGVIGGTGVYDLDALAEAERVEVDTPVRCDKLADRARHVARPTRRLHRSAHGEGHRLLPSEVRAHANIHALKQLGVERVLAASAVGSLQQQIEPLHAVVPDQLIDRTRGRSSTFFGEGLVAHIGFADPFCPGPLPRVSPAPPKRAARQRIEAARWS